MFARNLRRMAELLDLCREQDRVEAVKDAMQLRDAINDGFNAVKSQSDAVVFEFGPSRQRKLEIRNDVRRWQATLGTFVQVEITYLQYLFQLRLPDVPPSVKEGADGF